MNTISSPDASDSNRILLCEQGLVPNGIVERGVFNSIANAYPGLQRPSHSEVGPALCCGPCGALAIAGLPFRVEKNCPAARADFAAASDEGHVD